METKKCAVVFLDVVDYSRLMENDQLGTHNRFSAVMHEVLVPIVEERGGRVMRLLGDGILLEFPQGPNAIEFAIEFQERMQKHQQGVGSDQLMRFRIGANFGEVLYDAGEVYGTEVNIAARLEHIALPGGILQTDSLYDLLDETCRKQFVFGGNQALKNIDREVAVWSWNKAIDKSGSLIARTRETRRRPTVAVLPFDNFGGNTDDDYFVDGLTEDLITRLAYSRVIHVIDRNTMFRHRARPRDIEKIGEMLGAKYVLEGSVRRSTSKIRINAHLLDSETGSHVWAHTYNDEVDDVLETQDKISTEIVHAIFPAITSEEMWSSLRKSPGNLDAWDHVLHGLSELNKYKPERNAMARQHLGRALELDPTFAFANALMARSYYADGYLGWVVDDKRAFDKALEYARIAIDSDPLEAEGHIQMTWSGLITHNHDQALESSAKAVELNPAAAYANYSSGLAQLYAGDLDQAIDEMELALKLSPSDPMTWLLHTGLGLAYFCAGNYDRVVQLGKRCGESRHGLISSSFLLGISYGMLGDVEKAKNAAKPIVQMSENRKRILIRNIPFKIQERFDMVMDGLRRSGWQN